MFERFTRKSLAATGAAVLAALGIGGAAMAQSGKTPAKTMAPAAASQDTGTEAPGKESNAPENSATDTDNVQEGDQTGTDSNEPAEGPESAGEKAESGSEKANDDGPGGHADEPGNPNADTQQEGQH